MLARRIIPCLDVKDGRVVKGTNFEGLRDMADPVEMARFYNESGADELVFYDITASAEGRNLFTDILRRVAGEIFIPLTVGGGIRTLEDFDRVLKCGADKVSVNSGAIADPAIIGAAAKKYGDQCVVLSMDVKRVDGQFRLFAKGGREDTGIDAMEWAARGVADGAGEIVLNSIDTDGVKQGFDLEMLDALVVEVVKDGPACHTGAESCFFRPVYLSEELKAFSYEGLYRLIQGRKTDPKEGSYTTYLFEKGLDKILKKVGEECTEVIIGGRKEDREETIYEIADLTYHVMVLMVQMGITLEDVTAELEKRHVIDHKVKQERMQ